MSEISTPSIGSERISKPPYDSSIMAVILKCEKCFEYYEESNIQLEESLICSVCRNNTKNQIPEKFMHHKNARKLSVKSLLPTSCYSSLLCYQMPQVRKLLSKIWPDNTVPNTIIDCCCHVGGDTLHFAELYPLCNITAIDIDPKAIECLKQNMSLLEGDVSKRINIICSDVVPWIYNHGLQADLYYFDPEWGGPSYLRKEEISLYIGSVPVVEIINYILEKGLSQKILLKVPKNFAFQKFHGSVKGQMLCFHIMKPKKAGGIAYSLILITP
jgi:FkbM family methyltransferase